MSKTIKNIIFVAICATFIINILTIATYAKSAEIYKTDISVKYDQTEARKMFDMINEFRTGKEAWYWNTNNKDKIYCKDLNKLQYDYNLEKIAMQRAAEIAIYTSHQRPNGEMCFSAFGWSYMYFGENIAWYSTSAKAAMNNLKEENQKFDGQGHRRAMLNNGFTSVGLGHVIYNGMHYWVQEFGDRVVDTNKVEPNNSKTNVTIEVSSTILKSIKIVPEASKIKKITTKKKKANITWKEIKEASGYEIYISNKKNGKYSKIKKISKRETTKYTKAKLKKGKTYYFKIRTYKKIGNKKYYSKYSKVYKIKIK